MKKQDRLLGFLAVTSLLALVGCPAQKPQVAPPPAADAVAFFVRFGPDLLVPLGCKRLDQTRWDSGRACVSLATETGAIELEDIGVVEVIGPSPTQCAETRQGTTALAVRRAGGPLAFPERPSFGVWATNAIPNVQRVAEQASASQELVVDPAVGALWPAAGSPLVLQQEEVDLDHDGTSELVAVVSSGSLADDTLEGVQSAIVVRAGGELRAVHGPVDGRFQLLGFVDLDGDGRSEVWLRIDTTTSRTDRLEAWTPEGTMEIGSWGCP